MLKTPFFSIIIPTLNEEKYLPRLLKDLVKQSFQDFEVIHVDGNSEDETLAVGQEFTKKLKLKTRVVKKRNVAYQRNTGAKLARGEWLIFMDADNQLLKDFLATIKKQLLKNPEISVFSCWVSLESNEVLKKTAEKVINYALELNFLFGRPLAFGALIGCQRSLAKTTQFDETQKVYEDSKFVNELVNKGAVFQLFKNPTYTYSTRRMDKEGMIKMLRMGIVTTLHFMRGKDFSKNDFGYSMEGGKYYDQLPKTSLQNLKNLLKTVSENQRLRAKKILNQLKKL
ncbi:MAG TPA: glycosyltransferase family A protein [Patescibacteria group bacterium]|jgi:glycosyltransferase involved in cell wall biosynthesis